MKIASVDDVVIRIANNDDCTRVKSLIFAVLDEYGLPSDPESKDSDLNDIEMNYISRGGVFEVIEDKEGNLLGTYGLYPLSQETCELRKMYFVAQIRGRGLGRKVLERALDHARRLGFQTVELETISVLKEAIHLYISFGFEPTESVEKTARVDQRYILRL